MAQISQWGEMKMLCWKKKNRTAIINRVKIVVVWKQLRLHLISIGCQNMENGRMEWGEAAEVHRLENWNLGLHNRQMHGGVLPARETEVPDISPATAVRLKLWYSEIRRRKNKEDGNAKQPKERIQI